MSTVYGTWGSWSTRTSEETAKGGAQDVILEAFYNALTQREVDAELEKLLSGVVGEAIRRTIRRRSPQHVEELYGVAALRISQRLIVSRDEPNSDPIRNLEGYAVTVAEHTVEDALRALNPERARLRNRLRYYFETAPHLGLWEYQGQLVGGSVKRVGAGGGSLPTSFHPEQSLPVGDVVALALSVTKDAVSLTELTDALTRIWGFSEVPLGESEVAQVDGGGVFDRFQADEKSPHEQLQQREALTQLWGEIRKLPEKQRAALLLNLRDENRRGVIELLLLIISKEELMSAAGLWSSKEQSLWDALPLDDNSIAERLGVTRQQVINLRKVARERLQRHFNDKRKIP